MIYFVSFVYHSAKQMQSPSNEHQTTEDLPEKIGQLSKRNVTKKFFSSYFDLFSFFLSLF